LRRCRPRSGGQLRCRARGRFTLALDPYPFNVDTVDMPVKASIVPDRAYCDPEDFIATLALVGQMMIECTAVRP
jgi:hypothetical protein